MKNKILAGLALAACVLTGCASEKDQQAELMSQARISRADAQQTALAKVSNGTVKEGELEKEGGKLIWSFDVATPDSKDITEVNVDAVTGALVSADKESAADEAKESTKEKD